MIRRDRNHPSVVAWEASLNESDFSDEWAAEAHAIVHEEYPEAFSAAWKWSHADIFIGASQHGVRNSGDARPILISEYGDWDYGGAASTSRQAREAGDLAMLTQADNVEDGTSKNLALPWYSAGRYWDFADYAGFSSYGITRCGLVDMYRLPKYAYHFLRSQRDPTVLLDGIESGPMVYIANQWTSDSPTTVRVYHNCEEVRLSLDGVPIGTLSPDPTSPLPHPPVEFAVGAFTPGTLLAECLIGGVAKATFTRSTPGAATSIRLSAEGTTLDASPSDARLVFIEVVDGNGTVVPADASEISLSIDGPGSIVGPAEIAVLGGQLATWVRASRTPGTITLTATSARLSSGTVTLTSLAVADQPPAPVDRSGG
jgi:hypothetical protein